MKTYAALSNAIPLNARNEPVHRWADSDPRFTHLDYRGRRTIERAITHNDYLYSIVGHRTSRDIPEISTYYQYCTDNQIPFICVMARNRWSTVICDLSTSRTIIDPAPHIYNNLVFRMAHLAQKESWMCGDDPLNANWLCVESIECFTDEHLARFLVSVTKRHSVCDDSRRQPIGVTESTFTRWKRQSGPGWVRLSQRNRFRILSLNGFDWNKQPDPWWRFDHQGDSVEMAHIN
ncbi:hypothetical protein [Desulfomonile tiedjei]|uniref:Uncharacterized protein n=1 Tax=Desulfomonile tiedjei (strain ATCC 49306 / DSM 6799 / DCB-1) TaxID=706587 RepID=I4C5Z9_DESTA|nr:hypothetical protein [Desulfomonile tiedjei]AFM24990.1 hypothetical protein Desti_2302 [Desulfomonile tiedjei DSM 6799]